jgi:hypothetical protein
VRDLPLRRFHFVDEANARFVERAGLLSTNELLRRGHHGAEVEETVRAHRPVGVTLPDGVFIRDQAPMPPTALAGCLDGGLTPRDWYDLVNDHVFFWLDEDRARRHAIALRRRAQILLTIDVHALVAVHGDAVYVTPFNIGNARRSPAPRGRRTLVPLASWRAHGWKAETGPGRRVRAASHAPAELLVRGGVPDVARFVTHSERLAPW